MACPRPRPFLSGCRRLLLPRLPGCCEFGWSLVAVTAAAAVTAAQALVAPPNLCFSVPGNLGMDRLGAILLERETSWRMGPCPHHQGAPSGGIARNEVPASQMKTRSASYQRV